MKYIFILIAISGCSLLGGKPDPVVNPPQREEFHQCPYDGEGGELCGNKSGGICMPSRTHHSDAAHCPRR